MVKYTICWYFIMFEFKNMTMKLTALLVTALTVLLICCRKEDNKSSYIGEANAYKNGIKWEAYTHTSTFRNDSNKIDIIISTQDKNNIVREHLNILNLSLELGKHSIDTIYGSTLLNNFGITYTTLVDDGDVIGDEYYSPARNEENHVVVDSYDSITGDLSGRFNFYLVLGDRIKFDHSLPDTMRFTDGNFHIRIKL